MIRMIYKLIPLACWLLLVAPLSAQELSGLARVEIGRSQVTDRWGGGLNVQLALSQGVPYRAYTLTAPPRLVLDFREVDWDGVTKPVLLNADNALDLRFGTFRPGWSRMVIDLAGPLAIDQVDLRISEVDGSALLAVELVQAGAEVFAAQSGAPRDVRWDLPEPVARGVKTGLQGARPLVVVLDPGHGGIDPGAERSGYVEKDLMLTFAREMKETLVRSGGFEVVLTRDGDYFVSLERRIAIAHEVGADVLISLHADALAEGRAHGATLHLLSDSASDAATEKLAERHNRDDLLSGVDLTGQDDVVAEVLMDLARQETKPRSERMAQHMLRALEASGAAMNNRPLRHAGFSVLKAADIPSALLEIGFMSSPRDLKNLANKQWRISMAAAIRDALQSWVKEDLALSQLVRH